VHLLQLQPDETIAYELSPAPYMEPEFLGQIRSLERFVVARSSDAVGGVLGPSDYVSTVNFMIYGRRAEQRRIPEDRRHVERVWREYGNIRGPERLSQLVDPTFTSGIITVLLKNANFVDTARLMSALREYEKNELGPRGISLRLAGDVAVSQSLIEAIVRTEIQSLIGTLLGVLTVTIVLGRSVLFGLYCVVPSTLAVLVNFAVMGWAGLPLGVATSMFSAMTLGIGVDYAIHLLTRARRARGMHAPRDAIVLAGVMTGPAIFVDTLAVVLGFGILLLSQVPANARLGALVAMSMITCFVVTMVTLPALLSYKFEHGVFFRSARASGFSSGP
jgi:hypothetical protein